MDINFTYVEAGGYITSDALDGLKILIEDYGFSLEDREFGYFYELKTEEEFDLVFGLEVYVAPHHPNDAYNISLGGYDIMTPYEFDFLIKLREYILAHQWNPDHTIWRFYVGGQRNVPVRIINSKYNRCHRVLIESEWILQNQENAIKGIKALHSFAADRLSEDHIASRPAKQENVNLLHYEGALLYQQEVMIFGAFDGFCHQLSIAIQRDRNSIPFEEAFNNVIRTTFRKIESLETMLLPMKISLREERDMINKTLDRLYNQRNKKVHRGSRSYGDDISKIEDDYRLIHRVITDIRQSFSSEFVYSQKGF